jgi:hypothetical protein
MKTFRQLVPLSAVGGWDVPSSFETKPRGSVVSGIQVYNYLSTYTGCVMMSFMSLSDSVSCVQMYNQKHSNITAISTEGEWHAEVILVTYYHSAFTIVTCGIPMVPSNVVKRH